MTIGKSLRRTTGIILLLLLAGCASPSPKAHFYSLAVDPALAAVDRAAPVSIGVVPVALPGYLDRPQLVVRRESTVEVQEYHRWAGNLERDFSQVLAADLSRAIGSDRVAVYPLANEFAPTYRLAVDVDRFDGSPGQDVVLSGRWTLSSTATRQVLLGQQFNIAEATGGEGIPAFAEAHSRALAQLARSIAESIGRLP